MNAIIQLEQRILAELSEVQEIQAKLANSKMMRNLDQADMKAALLAQDDSMEERVSREGHKELERGRRKSRFARKGNPGQTKPPRGVLSQIDNNRRDLVLFEPSFQKIDKLSSAPRLLERRKSACVDSSGHENKPRSSKGDQLHDKFKNNGIQCKRSILDCEVEDENEDPTSRLGGMLNGLKNKRKRNSIHELESGNKVKEKAHKGCFIQGKEKNKENLAVRFEASPTMQMPREDNTASKRDINTSLYTPRKRNNPVPEFSFRPQLSSKSMRIAETLVALF